MRNYVLAIYGIKSGMDLCSRTYGDNQEISNEEKEDMAIVKGEVDQIMRKLENPPEKYAQLSTKLQSMYSNYQKLNDLANAPLGRLANLEPKVEEAKGNFSKGIADIKSNMPDQLADELKRSGMKYNLGFMH